jgi:16S rRNA (uracil1498-N3)-methyltransferase
MQLHRFFLGPEYFQSNTVTVEDAPILHQWVKVLRMKAGDQVLLCDGNQNEYNAKVIEADTKRAKLELGERKERKENFNCDVHLYFPPTNNQSRFELVLEKGTELGVKSFIPIITKRTQEKQLRKVDRLQNIIREAAEQSGRTILPQLEKEVSLEVALKQIPEGGNILVGYIGEAPALFQQKITKHPSFHVFIGPEGDFDKDELILLRDSGATPFSLGKQILRVETAAIAAATLLLCR